MRSCSIDAEQAPWQRIRIDQLEHAHAFTLESRLKRLCSVYHERGRKHSKGMVPVIIHLVCLKAMGLEIETQVG